LRPIAQHGAQRIRKASWLNQFGNDMLGHGVSLLWWRSGRLSTPTIRRPPVSRRHQDCHQDCHQDSGIAPLQSRRRLCFSVCQLVLAGRISDNGSECEYARMGARDGLIRRRRGKA
jgi:hypothetical protein